MAELRNYRVFFMPRGCWEIIVEAPNEDEASNLAEQAFDMATRASDDCWEVETVEESADPAEIAWEEE